MKIAVIGAGYWGKNLVRNFSELGVLDIVCDTGLDRLKDVRDKYPKVRTTASTGDVIMDKSIDGVVISTPAETHYRIAKECLLAGKNVFVEKPIALSVTEGRTCRAGE
jgi:UDP-2-acetamido-3-amino-2,3-dideoxy-glucuronate N-acetyltransferase